MKPFLKWCYFLSLILYTTSISAQEIVTIAGNGIGGMGGDGRLATDASLNKAGCLAFDSLGNMYIADGVNHRICKVSIFDKTITTIAGTGVQGYSGDGGIAKLARLNLPRSIAFDNTGQLYIADLNNRVVRKIDLSGNIHTVVGTGDADCSGDGGLASSAKLRLPYSICFDVFNNLYIADGGCHCIRKVNSDGIITTISGNGIMGYGGDGGPATLASTGYPGFIAIDNKNNYLYFPDYINRRVRKVDLNTGIMTTFAGNGGSGSGGDGGPATAASFITPNTASVDSLGNVLICDNLGHTIRKVDTFGIISTIAGTGEEGYSPDGTVATAAKLNRPNFTVTDKWGNIYFCDAYNHLVRRINYNTTSVKEQPITQIKASIFPNPAHEYVAVKTEGIAINELQMLDVAGCAVHNSVYKAHKGEIKLDIAHLPSGIYILKINGRYAGKVVKE